MEIPKIPKEKIVYYWAGSIFTVILMLYVFLYEPLLSKLKKAGNVCKAAETQVAEKRNNLKALKITEIRKILITEKEISLAIAELTENNKSRGIDYISITPMPIIISGDAKYNILPVEMEIESTYEALVEFLGSFDKLKESLITLGDYSIISYGDKDLLKTKLIINMYISAST